MKATILIIAVIAVLWIGFWFLSGTSPAPRPGPEGSAMPVPTPEGTPPVPEHIVTPTVPAAFISSAECDAKGGVVVFNDPENPPQFSADEFLGDLNDVKCPCFCLKKDSPAAIKYMEQLRAEEEAVKHFYIRGKNFAFEVRAREGGQVVPVNEMRVKKGTLVQLYLTSTDGYHDFVLDEFNVRTSRVNTAATTGQVDFIADKTGTFEYYCSVENHRAMGMKGTLTVTE